MSKRLRKVGLIMVWVLPLGLNAQNPAGIADAEMERQKILRAADQMEVLTHKMESMQLEITTLKQSVSQLKSENKALKSQISTIERNAEREREALLTEIGKIISEGDTGSQASAQSADEGYEHVVLKGQSLWAIANAFQKQGVKVTVEDIRKANNLKDGAFLKVGQKLFIPKK